MPTQKRARFVHMCLFGGMFFLTLGLGFQLGVGALVLAGLCFAAIALPVGVREATILPEPADHT